MKVNGRTIPNPGSDAAIRAGCICPVLENNRGEWEPLMIEWWVTEGCPIHDKGKG